MEKRTNNIFKYIEWKLIFAYLFLVLVGWISIYAAVYDGEHSSIWDFSCRYGKQMIWIAASLVIALPAMSESASPRSPFVIAP